VEEGFMLPRKKIRTTAVLSTSPVSCRRELGEMNLIKSKVRPVMHSDNSNNMLTIKLYGPPLDLF
jgi:hypothetical protein